MTVSLLYFSSIFILCLIATSNGLSHLYGEDNKLSENSAYSIFCFCFSIWGFCVVCQAFAKTGIWQHVLFYFAEFMMVLIFVSCFELIAYLTEYVADNKDKIARISGVYLYSGLATMFLSLVVGKGELKRNFFGYYYMSQNHIVEMVYALYCGTLLFGLFYLVITYMEKCKKPRDIFAGKIYAFGVVIVFLGMVVERCMFLLSMYFVPLVLFSYAVLVFYFQFCVKYKRSIQYREEDYANVLSPACERSILVCDDDNNILFVNKRGAVLAENERDSFYDKKLLDVFEFENNTRDYLEEIRRKEYSEVNATYIKGNMPVTLCITNQFDRFKRVFAAIVDIKIRLLEEDNQVLSVDNVKNDFENYEQPTEEQIHVSAESLRTIRTDSLIEMIDSAIVIYKNDKKYEFLCLLQGVHKMAMCLGIPAIIELSDRIIVFCKGNDDISGVEPMLNELERQCETLKVMRQ